MKKTGFGLSLLVALSLTGAMVTSAEETDTTLQTGETSSEVATQSDATINETSDSVSTVTNTTEVVESTEGTTETTTETTSETTESEVNDNPTVFTNEEGSFYLPQGRSDLNPSLFRSARATIPAVSATNSNTPTKSFVDVASYQGALTVANYRTMKNYGVTGVVVKLTEGTSYRNPYAKTQVNNAIAAGLKVGVYHYSHFTNASGARAEANYFARFAKELGLPASTVMVNDIEDNSQSGLTTNTANSQTFASQLGTQGYSIVKHYTGAYWVSSGKFNPNTVGKQNVWLAAYPLNVSNRNQYTDYAAWQWNSRLSFPGVSGNFDISADYTGTFSTANATAPSGYQAMYRMYNPSNGEHFYTANANERDSLLKIGWGNYEGVAWYSPINSSTPIYRLYNSGLRDHHYTASLSEANWLQNGYGWKIEGVAFKANSKSDSGAEPVYRLFHPYMTSGSHHYTKNWDEVTWLTKNHGWKYEGIAWYVK